MTTLDIIKAILDDDALKMRILNMYEFMKPEERTEIDYLAWTSYDELYDERLRENLNVQYDLAKQGKEPIGKDFHKRALDKTEREMTKEFSESLATADLSIARKAMEQIMHEIHAAKDEKKAQREKN